MAMMDFCAFGICLCGDGCGVCVKDFGVDMYACGHCIGVLCCSDLLSMPAVASERCALYLVEYGLSLVRLDL